LAATVTATTFVSAQPVPPTAAYDEEPAPAPNGVPSPGTAPSLQPPPAPSPPDNAPTPPGPPPAAAAPATVPPAATAPAAAPAPPLVYEPPPPPLRRPDEGALPAFSVRLDPLHWLIYGGLPIEIEGQIWRFITFEVTPIFVTSQQPPILRQSFDRDVNQYSNGIGSLAGAAIGPGFWLNGRPNRGTVLRAIFTNYSYRYEAPRTLDSLTHTERHLYAYIGSHSKWGVFTLASGVGLGVELNRQRRCFNGSSREASSDCANDELLLATGPQTNADFRSWPYPLEIMWRLSLGVAF
jgi:hypothetical protein